MKHSPCPPQPEKAHVQQQRPAAAAAAAAKSLQLCPTYTSVVSDSVRPHRPWSHQAPPSLGFSRQEHWSGLPFPSPMHESEK